MELEGLKVLTYIVGITSLIMALLALITVIAQTLLSSKLTSQPNTTENINITVTHQTNYGQPMKLELNYPSQDGLVSDDEIKASFQSGFFERKFGLQFKNFLRIRDSEFGIRDSGFRVL